MTIKFKLLSIKEIAACKLACTINGRTLSHTDIKDVLKRLKTLKNPFNIDGLLPILLNQQNTEQAKILHILSIQTTMLKDSSSSELCQATYILAPINRDSLNDVNLYLLIIKMGYSQEYISTAIPSLIQMFQSYDPEEKIVPHLRVLNNINALNIDFNSVERFEHFNSLSPEKVQECFDNITNINTATKLAELLITLNSSDLNDYISILNMQYNVMNALMNKEKVRSKEYPRLSKHVSNIFQLQTTFSENERLKQSLDISPEKKKNIAKLFSKIEGTTVTPIPKLLSQCDSTEELHKIFSSLDDTYSQVFNKTRSPEGTILQKTSPELLNKQIQIRTTLMQLKVCITSINDFIENFLEDTTLSPIQTPSPKQLQLPPSLNIYTMFNQLKEQKISPSIAIDIFISALQLRIKTECKQPNHNQLTLSPLKEHLQLKKITTNNYASKSYSNWFNQEYYPQVKRCLQNSKKPKTIRATREKDNTVKTLWRLHILHDALTRDHVTIIALCGRYQKESKDYDDYQALSRSPIPQLLPMQEIPKEIKQKHQRSIRDKLKKAKHKPPSRTGQASASSKKANDALDPIDILHEYIQIFRNPETSLSTKEKILTEIKQYCVELEKLDRLSEERKIKLKTLLPLLTGLPQDIIHLECSQVVFSLIEKFIMKTTKSKAKREYELARKVSANIHRQFGSLPDNRLWEQKHIDSLFKELESYNKESNIVVVPFYISLLKNLPQICPKKDQNKFIPLLNDFKSKFQESSQKQNSLFQDTLISITRMLDDIITNLGTK